MRWRHLLLNARPLRAVLESLLLAIILWIPLLLFQAHRSPNNEQLMIDFLVGPVCMLFYGLRLRVPADFLKMKLPGSRQTSTRWLPTSNEQCINSRKNAIPLQDSSNHAVN